MEVSSEEAEEEIEPSPVKKARQPLKLKKKPRVAVAQQTHSEETTESEDDMFVVSPTQRGKFVDSGCQTSPKFVAASKKVRFYSKLKWEILFLEGSPF